MNALRHDPALVLADRWQRGFPLVARPFAELGRRHDLTEAETFIAESCEEMKATLLDVERNVAHIDLYPMVENEWACKRCQYRKVCGGCRARAYAMIGDVLGEDPICPYEG